MAFLVKPCRLPLVMAADRSPCRAHAARGELLEVRAADLRFTADEAAAYLNERWT